MLLVLKKKSHKAPKSELGAFSRTPALEMVSITKTNQDKHSGAFFFLALLLLLLYN